MRRAMVTASLTAVLTAGCHSPTLEPEAAPEEPAKVTGTIDYAGWPRLTEKLFPVASGAWLYCAAPRPDSEIAKERKRLGPHFAPAIIVYANSAAHAHLRGGGAGPMPVGSVIVKEKVSSDRPTQAFGYGAMIKREAGYDPEHGDWEYVYATLGEGGTVERGKLESCIACHAGQANQDYLFRTYEKAGQ